MLIGNFCSGASYSAGTFSIPTTSLSSAIVAAGGTALTASDSIEKLLFSLLQLVQLKQANGTMTDVNAGVKVASAGITQSTQWETSMNVFTQVDVQSLVAAFRLTNATLQPASNIASV